MRLPRDTAPFFGGDEGSFSTLDCGENDRRTNSLEGGPRDARAKAVRSPKLHQFGESLAMGEETRACLVGIVEKLGTVSAFVLIEICTSRRPHIAQADWMSSPFRQTLLGRSFGHF
jgi:hypothetical protein